MAQTVVVSDTFTGTNGTPLTSHRPDTGTAWTLIQENSAFLGEIENGVCQPSNTGNETHRHMAYRVSPSPSSAEYDVGVKLAGVFGGTSGHTAFIFARFVDVSNHYVLQLLANGNKYASLRLWKKVGGKTALLGSYDATLAAGDLIKLEIRNAAKKVYHNGVQRISSNDNVLTPVGSAALAFGGSDSIGNPVFGSGGHISADWKLDDFKVTSPGTVATTPSTPSTTISVTVGTSPTGRTFSVDGTSYSTTQTFSWPPGSSHMIATTSPQGTGTRYVFSRWSDGGGISHTVAPTAAATYTATFSTEYQLAMVAGTGGTVSPASGRYYAAGTAVQISATPTSGFGFSSWGGTASGSYSGPNNPATVTMNAPITETAAFIADRAPTTSGIWVGADELGALPMSGAGWTQVSNDAANTTQVANVGDQDSQHDVYTMAAALTCVRNNQHCAKAVSMVVAAIGTEGNERWLAISRNLGGYIIAADLLGLRDDGNPNSYGSRVEAWIRSFLTRQLPDNNSGTPRYIGPFHSGSNAAAQEGFIYAAIGAYINDTRVLDRAWDAFRTFAGDPTAPDHERIDLAVGVSSGWAHDNNNPVAVNPLNTTKTVPAGLPGAGTTHRIDGAIINDIQRGGDYQWPPLYTQYPWTGLAGFVPAAVILERAGHPAMAVADQAVRRAVHYPWFLRQDTGTTAWFDYARGSEVVALVNYYYGTTYTHNNPVNRGHTVGYTGWTHQ